MLVEGRIIAGKFCQMCEVAKGKTIQFVLVEVVLILLLHCIFKRTGKFPRFNSAAIQAGLSLV